MANLDDTQLHRLYEQETMYHVNPPSFATWLRCRMSEERALREREDVLKTLKDKRNG